MDDVFDAPFDLELPSKELWRDRVWTEIEEGCVHAEIVDIPAKTKISPDGFSGRTDHHRRLCATTAEWLARRGMNWTAKLGQLGYAGGNADVASTDGTLFVECGYVRPEKILRGLARGTEMLVVPYATDAVLFRRLKELRFEKYLRDLQREDEEIAERMFKR